MNRRALLRVLGGVLVAPIAEAQQTKELRRIGVLRPGPDSRRFRLDFEGFRQALSEGGYREGKDVTIEYRMGPGSAKELLPLARQLVSDGVAVMVAIAPVGVSAAAGATTTIPIVAVDLETDPLASGFVRSLARPGGNVTGVFLDFPELTGKWLQLLQEAVPRLSRVAALWDPATGPAQINAAESAAATLRLQLQQIEARSASEIDAAIGLAGAQHSDALLVLSSPVFNAQRRRIAELTIKHRLPAIMLFPEFAEEGGLLGYGPLLAGLFAQAAGHVVKLMKGVPATEIPIERPARLSLAINLKTAAALGVTIAPSLLLRADQVIR